MRRVFAAALVCAAFACATALGAVTGEWRVNLLRGSSTINTVAGATADEAWANCQALIPKSAPAATTYRCQTLVYAATVTADPPACPPAPASATRPQDCPAGSTGTWTQTSTSTVGPAPACAVSTTWSPSSPPAGACNRPPTITGTPTAAVVAGQPYSFVPVAADPDADTLAFTIVNRPNWATFNAATGALTGTPAIADVGIASSIVITVSDGRGSASTSAFTITVTAPPPPPPTVTTLKINVGGPALSGYVADVHFSGGGTPTNCTRTLTGIFATRRQSTSAVGFSYAIPLPSGRYTVRLLARECYFTASGQRVQRAAIEGQQIPAYDTWAASNPVIQQERVVDVTDGTLNISVLEVTGRAILNGIEIESADGAPPPPPPPAGNGTASLSWTPPLRNTDGSSLSNLAGFRIVYGTAPGSLTRTIQIPNAGVSAYVVESLAAGTWYFALRAYDATGAESAQTNVATKVVQ